jgi:hypothetical protein
MDDWLRQRQLFFSMGQIGRIDDAMRLPLIAAAHPRISAHASRTLGYLTGL